MIIYEPLRNLLKKRGIKFEQLKNECFNGHPSITTRLSKDRNVTTDTIDKVCTYLCVQPSEIMEWIPDAEYEKRMSEKANAERIAIEAQIAELQAKLKKM